MGCHNTTTTQLALLGECGDIDIGCVGITNGIPTEGPLQDQLPFAYDPNTESLWIYQCDNGPWTEIKHETLCELSVVDIETIVDVCTNLQIPITYDNCEIGRVTLQGLAEKIEECLGLENICDLTFMSDQVVDASANVDLAACVDGVSVRINPFTLCRLPSEPLPNLLNTGLAACVGGQDVLIPPDVLIPNICELDSLTQQEVDAAANVEITACVDGDGVLIPPPLNICELDQLTQAEVDAAANVNLTACVDGDDVLIPPPPSICELDQLTQAEVDAAANVNLAACVDGDDVLIPPPPPSLNICELDQLNQAEVDAAANVNLAACVDGDDVLIPTPPSPDDICDLNSLTQQEVDAATIVEMAACVDGVPSKIPRCCYEPVVIKGLGGRTGACYIINNNQNPGAKLFDSRFGQFEGIMQPGLPVEWMFTNTTTEPGIVRIHGSFWITRYETNIGNYSRTPANLAFMFGLKTSTDSYDFDETAIQPAAHHPKDDDDVSYDSRTLPTEPIYKFFGNWFSNVNASANLSMEADADIDHEFEIAAGQTLTFAAVTAIGYQTAINTGGGFIERSWLGFNIHYTFEGHNKIS